MDRIINRKGRKEKYDQKKVYASVYAAALNCHLTEQQAEKIALQVMNKINDCIKKNQCLTSKDIRDQVIKNIKNNDVMFMYKHHMDLC